MARFSARFSMRLTRSLPEPFVFIGRAPRAVQLRNSRRRRPAPESNDPSPLREPLSTRGGWKAILPQPPNLLLQNRLGSREYPARFTVLPCPPPLPRCSPRPVELLPFAFFLRSCWNFFVADIMEAIGAARAVGKPRGSASILIASRTREPARARPRPKMT